MKSITSTSLAQTLAVFCLLFCFAQAKAQGWERIYDLAPSEKFNDGIRTQDGGFVMTGTAKNGASGFDSLLVMVRTDFAGDEIWRRIFLMGYPVYNPMVEQLSDGSLVLVYGARDGDYDQLRIRRVSAWGDLLYDNLVIEAPVLLTGGAIIRTENGDNLIVGGSRLLEIDADLCVYTVRQPRFVRGA